MLWAQGEAARHTGREEWRGAAGRKRKGATRRNLPGHAPKTPSSNHTSLPTVATSNHSNQGAPMRSQVSQSHHFTSESVCINRRFWGTSHIHTMIGPLGEPGQSLHLKILNLNTPAPSLSLGALTGSRVWRPGRPLSSCFRGKGGRAESQTWGCDFKSGTRALPVQGVPAARPPRQKTEGALAPGGKARVLGDRSPTTDHGGRSGTGPWTPTGHHCPWPAHQRPWRGGVHLLLPLPPHPCTPSKNKAEKETGGSPGPDDGPSCVYNV